MYKYIYTYTYRTYLIQFVYEKYYALAGSDKKPDILQPAVKLFIDIKWKQI